MGFDSAHLRKPNILTHELLVRKVADRLIALAAVLTGMDNVVGEAI